MVSAKGWNGSVSFDGRFVTIRRNTIVGRFTMGRSDKRIPVVQVTALQLKLANVVTNGFIQFSFSGAEERNDRRRQRIAGASTDENTVMFLPWHNEAFLKVREQIEEAMAGAGDIADTVVESTGMDDPAARLRRLADLYDLNLLTAQEYADKRAEVLRRM